MVEKTYEPVVGDQAELISGGPKMTVAKITKAAKGPPVVEDSIDCWWFDCCEEPNKINTLQKASFPPAALRFELPIVASDEDEAAAKAKSAEPFGG